jgi:hypothetical protein
MKEDLTRELAYTMDQAVFRNVDSEEDERILTLDIRRRLLPTPDDTSMLAAKINEAVQSNNPLLFPEGAQNDQMARNTLKKIIGNDQPFGILLRKPEFQVLLSRLQTLVSPTGDEVQISADTVTLRALIRELINPDMACRNGLIADFNIVLSGTAASNTMIISLGAGAASKGTSMYTAKYMGKDSVNIKDSAVVFADAAKHVKEYISTADDTGTSQRTAQNLAQRIINKASVELEASQAAGIVLGLRSSNGSETLSYHSCWDVLRLARIIEKHGTRFTNYNFKPEDPTETNQDSEQDRETSDDYSSGLDDFILPSEDEDSEERHAYTGTDDEDPDSGDCNTGSEESSELSQSNNTDSPSESNDDDIFEDSDTEEDVLSTKKYYGYTKVYRDENDDPVVISEAYHYLWKDARLDNYNFHTFCLLFRLKRMTQKDKEWLLQYEPLEESVTGNTGRDEKEECKEDEVDDSVDETPARGRQPQPRYELKHPHPLRNSHILVKTSKWGIFAYAGRPPPREPIHPGENTNSAQSLSYNRRLKKYAHFYCATFIPFSTSNPPDISVEAWQDHVRNLEEEACYRSARENDDDVEGYKKRMIACGQLYDIDNAKTGFQECKKASNLTAKHRLRSRTLWDTNNKPVDFTTLNSSAQDKAQKVVRELQESAARLRGTKSLTTRLTAATKIAAWTAQLVNSLPASSMSGLPQQPGEILKSKWKVAHAPQYRTGTTVDYDLAVEMENLLSPPPQSQDTLLLQPISQAQRTVGGTNHTYNIPPGGNIKIPKELQQISEQEYNEECKEYQKRQHIQNTGGEHAGKPPLNTEQRAVGEPFIKVALIRRNGRRGRKKPQEINAIINTAKLSLIMLLTGAGGTGKSALIHILKEQMKALKCGYLLVTAYTGVAAAPFGGPTLLKLLGFGIKTKDHTFVKQLTPQNIVTLKKKFLDECGVNIEDIGGIVIDEVSFNDITLFGHIDGRLRQLMGQPTLFCGGIPMLFCGDNHQKAPPGTKRTWYQELVQHAKDPSKGPYVNGPSTARANGHRLLVSARRYNLNRMMRAKNDPQFQKYQEQMRNTSSLSPVSKDFVKSLKTVTLEDMKSDEEWLFAPVGVLSRIERDAINIAQMITFAKHFDLPLVKWRLPMYDIIPDVEICNGLYENEPNMFGYFVEGAPVHMTETIKSVRKLVNGTPALLDSLVLREEMEATRVKTASKCANAQ